MHYSSYVSKILEFTKIGATIAEIPKFSALPVAMSLIMSTTYEMREVEVGYKASEISSKN